MKHPFSFSVENYIPFNREVNIFGNGFYSLPDFLLNLIDAIYNFPLVVSQ